MLRILVNLPKIICFRFAWLRWFFSRADFTPGDPLLGSGEVRKENIKVLLDRHFEKEPKPENFGLPPGRSRD